MKAPYFLYPYWKLVFWLQLFVLGLSAPVIKYHDQKATWGGKSLFHLIFYSPFILDKTPRPKTIWRREVLFCLTLPHRSASSKENRARTQGKNLEAGTEADRESCVQACFSSWLAQLAFLYSSGPCLIRCDTTHGGLNVPSSSTINQEDTPRVACRPILRRHFLS